MSKEMGNQEAEQCVLGLILVDHNNYDDCQLKPHHFLWPEHSKIFEILSREIETGGLISAGAMQKKYETELEAANIPKGYLLDLYANVPQISPITHYEKEVMRQYIRRETMAVVKAVSGEIENSVMEEPAALLSRIDGILASFDKTETQAHTLRSSLRRASEWMEQARAGNSMIYKTGIEPLDYKLGGLKPGGLYVLAGRPGMGKTVAALNMAEHIAQTRPVLFFSLEMPTEELSMRLIAGRTSIPVFTQMQGKLDANDIERINAARAKLETLSLIINDTAGVDIDYIFSTSRKFARKYKDGVIIIDHLGLIRGNPKLQKVHQIEEITTKLKTLSKTIKAPVVLLSQLSRAVELRDDKKPMLSDLRDSGSIEQDADVVMFAYRPEYYAERKTIERTEKMSDTQWAERRQKHEDYLQSVRGKAFIFIEKNRQGISGTVELKFDGIRQKFS